MLVNNENKKLFISYSPLRSTILILPCLLEDEESTMNEAKKMEKNEISGTSLFVFGDDPR